MRNDEADRLIAHIERNMDPSNVQRIIDGDPDAPKPLGIPGLRNSKALRMAGFYAPFSGGPVPHWIKEGKW